MLCNAYCQARRDAAVRGPFVASAVGLLVLGLAGCLAPLGLSPEVLVDPAAELRQRATPDDGRGTVEDAWLLQASLGPDAPLTSFQWHLPAGSARQSKVLDAPVVTLELVSLLPWHEQGPLEAFFAGAYLVRDGRAMLAGGNVEVPGTSNHTDLGEPSSFEVWPYAASKRLVLRDVADADDVRLVIGGQSNATRPVDFLLMVTPGYPFEGEEPVSFLHSPGQALERLGDHRVLAVPPLGTGEGLWGASYTYFDWPWAGIVSESVLGAVQVDVQVTDTPRGPLVTRTYSAALPVSSGWSLAYGGDHSNGIAGTWSASGMVHGLQVVERSGTLGSSDDDAISLAGAFAGSSAFILTAEGPGAVDLNFQTQVLETSTEVTRFFFLQTLGTPLETLIGVPGSSDYDGRGTASQWLQAAEQLGLPTAPERHPPSQPLFS